MKWMGNIGMEYVDSSLSQVRFNSIYYLHVTRTGDAHANMTNAIKYSSVSIYTRVMSANYHFFACRARAYAKFAEAKKRTHNCFIAINSCNLQVLCNEKTKKRKMRLFRPARIRAPATVIQYTYSISVRLSGEEENKISVKMTKKKKKQTAKSSPLSYSNVIHPSSAIKNMFVE